MGKQIATAIKDSGLDLAMEQFVLLSILNSNEDIIQQDIAHILHKDKSGVLRIIDSLQKKKMIVRVADTVDRRKKNLVLTKKGAETIQKALELEAKAAERFLEGMSENDLIALSKALSIIKSNAQK
ncbi:hypothetical protein GCM10022209_00830 [Chitinophaga oryziterrae]